MSILQSVRVTISGYCNIIPFFFSDFEIFVLQRIWAVYIVPTIYDCHYCGVHIFWLVINGSGGFLIKEVNPLSPTKSQSLLPANAIFKLCMHGRHKTYVIQDPTSYPLSLKPGIRGQRQDKWYLLTCFTSSPLQIAVSLIFFFFATLLSYCSWLFILCCCNVPPFQFPFVLFEL